MPTSAAWDALLAQCDGDAEIAQSVAESMAADKRAELSRAEKAKAKGGKSVAEKIAAEKARKVAIENARASLAAWENIAEEGRAREEAAAEQGTEENTTEESPTETETEEPLPPVEDETGGTEATETAEPQTGTQQAGTESGIVGRSMTASEAQKFVQKIKDNADVVPEIALTEENWEKLFGKDGVVSTPIGDVKMRGNQSDKLKLLGRNGKLGMVKPTLETPQIIIEDASSAKEGQVTERPSSYVFVHSFKKADGNRHYYFTSVTVSKDGKEVVVSNQEKTENRLLGLLQNGKIKWIDEKVQSASETQNGKSVLLDDSRTATQADNNTAPLGVNSSELSAGKGTANSQIGKGIGGENVEGIPDVVNDKPKGKEKASAEEPKPVGKGAFGAVYDQFKGKVKEAFDFLAKKKSGDLLSVFHREGMGDIDLVWGDKKGGLAHILAKHVGEGKSYKNIDEAAKSIADIIDTGEIDFENGDKLVLKKGGKQVVLRKNIRKGGVKTAVKNWLLTAYDEKSADGRVGAISATNQDHAARVTDELGGKGTENSASAQETGVENSQEGEETGTKPAEEAAKTDEVKEEKPKQPKGGKSSAEGKGRTREERMDGKQTSELGSDEGFGEWQDVGEDGLTREELDGLSDAVMAGRDVEVVGANGHGYSIRREADGSVTITPQDKTDMDTLGVERITEDTDKMAMDGDGKPRPKTVRERLFERLLNLDDETGIERHRTRESAPADSADGGLLFRGEETGTGTATGRSSETVAGRRAAMAAAARDAAARLGLDNVDVVEDARGLDGRLRDKKGWYNPGTGRITVVADNHTGAADVMRTLLHEGVAHHGLRGLFGERFGEFVDGVYENGTDDVRAAIDGMAARGGLTRAVATEEYLAGLAERGAFEGAGRGLWEKVKRLFRTMLRKAGLKADGLTDADLRYTLWQSYENLRRGGSAAGALDMAADMAKREELGIGNERETPAHWGRGGVLDKAAMAANGVDAGLLFRDSIEDTDDTVRVIYNRRAGSALNAFLEAHQDGMWSVRLLQVLRLYMWLCGDSKNVC